MELFQTDWTFKNFIQTFSSLLGDFYGWHQKPKETKDEFISTRFWVECIAIFRTRFRKPTKTIMSTNTIKFQRTDADQPAKSANQLCRAKKERKIRAQTEVTQWQKKEIKNLKVASMQLDPNNDRGHDLYV